MLNQLRISFRWVHSFYSYVWLLKTKCCLCSLLGRQRYSEAEMSYVLLTSGRNEPVGPVQQGAVYTRLHNRMHSVRVSK